ncbi:MAG: uroporphyrinogen-III synthase [Gammaproteobacteria bacterium]|nr:uroporphyrinogen-III synthase [Gammaproteobacteria bacterium]
MAVNLIGKNIMVLRPIQQSEGLCRRFIEAGGNVTRFPTIEIQPLDDISTDEIKDLIEWSDVIIFISRNAVRVLEELAGSLQAIMDNKTVYAAGSGSEEEVRSSGVVEVISPGARSGSEALLQMMGLESEAILGKKVLIVRGDYGRELLKQELESRGALVKYADIYTRVIPKVTTERVENIWQHNSPDIIVVTSNQGLFNLIKMTPDIYHDRLFATDIVTMSKRISDAAIKEGFHNKIAVAESQTDQGLYDAAVNYLE